MIDGPAWAEQGLGLRAGRYPLAVEAPVLNLTATLVPGLSTQTQFARYYGLYWALADRAERAGLDADACRRAVRRAELLLAHVTDRENGRDVVAHGAEAMVRGRRDGRLFWALADIGEGTYSPRAWGFWGQYGGPSDTLGTVTTDGRALRPGRHPCPPDVRDFFAPLLDVAIGLADPDPDALLPRLESYDLGRPGGPDLAALAELFTAFRDGHHDPGAWTGPDRTRRATFRIVARAGALLPGRSWLDALRSAVAYGDTCVADPVLAADADHAAAWRGLLLRHRSVGAWRRLWAGLVDQVVGHIATRDDLYAWITDRLPDQSVANLLAGLPPVVDGAGHPADAETGVAALNVPTEHRDLLILVLGSRRVDALSGAARVAFLGSRPAFLDPRWVERQVADHVGRSVRDLGRALVDDMLAQSRRVALRKLRTGATGLTVFSRIHERDGTYTAASREGATNVGLRVEQLAGLARQLGLVAGHSAGPPTPLGGRLLGTTS